MGLGKWILAGLGWSTMGPIGGIIGYLLGRAFEGRSQSYYETLSGGGQTGSSSRRYTNTGGVGDINVALLVLMAAVMKADEVVKKSELDLVKRFLVSNYGEEKAKEMLLKLRDMQKNDIPVNDVCQQIKMNTDYTTRYHMLDFLFSIASSDGDVVNAELNLLHTISNRLGINSRDYGSIMNRHVSGNFGGGSYNGGYSTGSTSKKDPYKVLGLESTATDEEIRKAYRRLAMKYHPDRVEGMGEDVKRNAEAQFREINEAYETLKTMRGIK